MVIPAATVLLLRAVCSVLDEHASTRLLGTFAVLLADVPPLHICMATAPAALASLAARGTTEIVNIPYGAWLAKFSTKQAWQQVHGGLLPALVAACQQVTTNSQLQQQDGMFRDVAVSAWTCCNPGCTNMAGQQEASLALSKCAGCGEARYCSK